MYCVDCFSSSCCGWDVGRQNKEDPMHQVCNLCKAIYCLMLNIGKMGRFSSKRRNCEVQLERFPELMPHDELQDDGYIYIYTYMYIHMYIISVCILYRKMKRVKPKAPWQATEAGVQRLHDTLTSMKWPQCK